VLCREGSAGQSCFLVVVGEVEVVKRIDESDRVLATLGVGSLVGQMALVDRSPRSASVRAGAETIALEVTRDVFERLLGACSPLAVRFQEHIAIAGIRQLRYAIDRLTLALGRTSLPPGRASHAGASQVRNLELAAVQAGLN